MFQLFLALLILPILSPQPPDVTIDVNDPPLYLFLIASENISGVGSGSRFLCSFDYLLTKGRYIHKFLLHFYFIGGVWGGRESLLTCILPPYIYRLSDTVGIGSPWGGFKKVDSSCGVFLVLILTGVWSLTGGLDECVVFFRELWQGWCMFQVDYIRVHYFSDNLDELYLERWSE